MTAGTVQYEKCLLAGFLAVIALLAIYPASDADTFWHLANGRWMVEHGAIVRREVFSYTAPGVPFENSYWLAQLFLFFLHQSLGVNGLIAFKVIVMVAVFWSLYRAARNAGAGIAASFVMLALTGYALVWRMLERPELFTLLLLALMVAVLLSVSAGIWRRAWLWSVPPGLLLWEMLHPGSVFGLALLGAYTAGEWAGKVWPGGQQRSAFNLKQEPEWTLLLVTAASFLLQLLNPDSFLRSAGFASLTGHTAVFREFGEFMRTPLLAGFAPFWIMAGMGTLSAGVAFWQRRWAQFLVLAVFLYLGVAYARGTAIYAIVAAPYLARDLSRIGDRLQIYPHAAAAMRWLSLGALGGFALFTVHYKFFAEPHPNSYGWGLNETVHPLAAVRFLDDAKVDGPMFNLGHQGGFLAFYAPARPIFLYNLPSAFAAVLQDMRAFGLANRREFNYAIIGDDYANWRWQFPIEEWAAVYWEPAAMVMLRRSEANRALIERYEIRIFTPFRTTAELRALANQPAIAPWLARELADHLAWRRDDRLAALLADILRDPRSALSADQRVALLRRAQRSNAGSLPLQTALNKPGS